MTAASGEKVLVWQTIIGNRCIAATGGVSTLVNPATGGAVAWMFQRGGISERE